MTFEEFGEEQTLAVANLHGFRMWRATQRPRVASLLPAVPKLIDRE
jgi:hypothetical protein